MKTTLDCIPCFFRQAIEAGRHVSDDTRFHEKLLREAAKIVAVADLDTPPPVLGQLIHRRLRELVGVSDPWKTIRDSQNAMAMSIMPWLTRMLDESTDRLALAVRLAVAGNIIDLGVGLNPTIDDLKKSVTQALEEPIAGDFKHFTEVLAKAGTVLYLADNAGEIVFDRMLIEQIGPERVTVAVKAKPVINDAIMSDAVSAGLTDIVKVIDNGSDAPGTIIDDCSPEFRNLFESADLIIAKGQGNYETLGESDAPIAFLLKVKCPVVEALTGLPVGEQALCFSRALNPDGVLS